MMTSKTPRLKEMDFARVLCMLWITGFYHINQYIKTPLSFLYNDMCSAITIGVLSTFTFISGYFSGKKNIKTGKEYCTFIKKKMERLYPLLVIAAVGYLICGIYNAQSCLSTVFLFGIMKEPYPMTLWYMCMLILFVFVTPIVCTSYKPWVRVLISALLWGFMGGWTLLGGLDERVSLYWVSYSAGLIFANCDLSSLMEKMRYCLITMGFGIVSFVLSILAFSISKNYAIKVVIGLSFTAIFLIVCRVLSRNLRETKLIDFLSYLSMCSYLMHRVVFQSEVSLLGTMSVWEFYMLLPMLYVFSYCIQKLYDKACNSIWNKVRLPLTTDET